MHLIIISFVDKKKKLVDRQRAAANVQVTNDEV